MGGAEGRAEAVERFREIGETERGEQPSGRRGLGRSDEREQGCRGRGRACAVSPRE